MTMTNNQGWTPAAQVQTGQIHVEPATAPVVEIQHAAAIHSAPQPVLPPIAELPKFRGGHVELAELPLPANKATPFPPPSWAWDKDEHGRKTGQMHVVMPTLLIDEAYDKHLCWEMIDGEPWLFVYVFSTSASSEPSPVLIRLRPDDVSPTFPPFGGQDPYTRVRCLHIAAVNQWCPKVPDAASLPALQEAAKQAAIQQAAAAATQPELVQGEVTA